MHVTGQRKTGFLTGRGIIFFLGPTPANCLETRAKVRDHVIMINQQIKKNLKKAGGM